MYRLFRLPRVGFNVRRNRRVRNRKNRVINRRPPNTSTKPQRYGPGRLITNITLELPIIAPNTITSINLGEQLKSNLEFTELSGKFNYFKLIAIKVILLSYQFQNTTKSGVFVLNWHGEPPGDLTKSDNAKLFGPINITNKIWKFIPPKMVIGTTNTDSAPINLNEYINIHRFTLPAWIHVFHEFTGQNMPFKVELVIETRGITMLPSSSKLDNILKQIELLEKNITNINLIEDNKDSMGKIEEKKEEIEGENEIKEDQNKWDIAKERIEKLMKIITDNKIDKEH